MKLLLATALAFAALSSVASAGTIENSFGNTLIVTQANAPAAQYQLNPDHTFIATIGANHITGAWEMSGEQLCVTPQGGERSCAAWATNKAVGDTWTQAMPDGSSATITLRAGR